MADVAGGELSHRSYSQHGQITVIGEVAGMGGHLSLSVVPFVVPPRPRFRRLSVISPTGDRFQIVIWRKWFGATGLVSGCAALRTVVDDVLREIFSLHHSMAIFP